MIVFYSPLPGEKVGAACITDNSSGNCRQTSISPSLSQHPMCFPEADLLQIMFSFKFVPISLNYELNFSNYSVFNNSSLTPNMWINCTRHVLIFIHWDTGEIKAYLLSTQHQKTTKWHHFLTVPLKL